MKEAVFDIGSRHPKAQALCRSGSNRWMGLGYPSEDLSICENCRKTSQITEYMKSKEPEKYKKYFSLYIKIGLNLKSWLAFCDDQKEDRGM
jgi:hypothetical protein